MIIEQLDVHVRTQMLAHATLEAPREACGVLARFAGGHLAYCEGVNTDSEGRDRFRLDPSIWAVVEDAGAEVAAIVHSHPGYSANPSMADRAQCEASGLPWVIVGLPSGHLVELAPSGWSAPLEGREFHFGVLDCYTLVQDWYHRTWGLVLPDFERTDGFWERGEHLYRNGLAEAGFVVSPTRDPQVGDGLLMRVNSPEVDNHAAVYLGEGMMLHHLWGQPSRVERWDWPWQRRTTAIVRHRSRLPEVHG